MADRKLIVQIVGDDDALLRAFRRSGAAGQRFGRDMSSVSSRLGSVFKVAAVAAGTAGIGALAVAFRAGIKEAADAAKVSAQTQAVLKSTGGQANVTARQIDDLASSLLKISGVDDEVIKGGENLLLTFRNIRNVAGEGNDIFNQATRAALDLSVAFGKDMSSAAILVGKALNDPIKGLTALQRVGVTFTQQQRDQIKALVDSGNALAAQKVIIAELNREVGGSAAAVGKTLGGQFNILKETLNNVAGEIVGHFTPAIQNVLERLNTWLQDSRNVAKIQRTVSEAVRVASAAFAALKTVFDALKGPVGAVVDALGGLKNTLEVLAVAAVVGRMARLTGAITGLSTQALVARDRAVALRGALLRLAAIGTIVIGVEILLNKDQIDKTVTNFLRSHKLGFLTGAQIEVPVNATVKDLEKLRDQYRKLGGTAGDLAAKAIDKFIAKLKEQKKAAEEAGQATAQAVQPRNIQAAPGGQINVPRVVAPRGITASQRNQFFDAAIGSDRDLIQDQATIQGQIAALQAIAKKIQERINATKDVTRRLNLEAELRDVFREIAADRKQLAENVRQASADSWSKLQDALQFDLERAQATAGFGDDLSALKRIQAAIKKRMAEEGRTAELLQQLFENRQQINETLRNKQAARQFQALGLGPTGEEITPGVENLRKQLASLTARISGTRIDTGKLRSQLAGIRKVLSGELGKATVEARQRINELFTTIRQSLDEGSKGPLTKTHGLNTDAIVAGLGLDAAAIRELRGRLSKFNTAGLALSGPRLGGGALAGAGGGIVVDSHITVNLDSQKVATAVTKQQQRANARNPRQKRGPNRR